MQSNPRSSLCLTYATSFQQASVDDVYVLGSDGNLWLEHAVSGNFGQIPPPREQVDSDVQAFQVVDLQTAYVLSRDGGVLWLEHAVNGKFGQAPPPREQVDSNVVAFQALDTNTVVVLGSDGNLWMEHAVNGKFGQVPPPREQVDSNVVAFQAIPTVGSSSIFSTTVLVLDSENNLWMDHAASGVHIVPVRSTTGVEVLPENTSAAQGAADEVQLVFGTIPPPRDHVETAVAAFQAIDTNTIYILDTGGTLWLEHSVNGKFGQIPAPRTQLATQVVAFQGIDANTVYYLWETKFSKYYTLYSLSQGALKTINNQVLDFSVTPQIIMLGSDCSLWLVTGAIGPEPPPPVQKIDGNVAAPTIYGTLRPSYLLLTVIYAPPGTSGGKNVSTVEYGTSSSTGSTVKTTSSFKAGVDVKASVGSELEKASAGFSFSGTNTDEVSVQKTQSEESDLTVPGPPVDGIDHDYDQFYLWLNPVVRVTADNQSNVTWEIGIDGETITTTYVSVGELKNPATMSAGLTQLLDSAGFSNNDGVNLLNSGANPFVSDTQVLVGPGAVKPSVIDPNRFLPVTIPSLTYRPPDSASGEPNTAKYAATNSVDQNTTTTSEVQIGVSFGVTLGVKDVISVDVTESFQWTHSSSYSTENKSSQSAELSITGPSYGYSGSINLQVYWDTVWSTFMFALA
jgi:hypothetical protein